MKKLTIFAFALVAVFLMLPNIELTAQCSMCKAVLESNLQSGESAVGKGVNDGIVYIMFVPYILLGAVGFFMYKHYKKEVAQN